MNAPVFLLLVDDPEEATRLSGLIARHFPGARITTAPDPAAVRAAIEHAAPDCILLQQASAAAAAEACANAKACAAERAPVLALTPRAFGDAGVAEILEAGADGILDQPSGEAIVAAKLRVLLRIKEAEEALRTANSRLADLVAERGRALRQSEARYRLLFNNVSDAIFLIELDENYLPGRILEVNDAACQKSGYSREELLNLTVDRILAPERIEALPVRMESVVKHTQVMFESVYLKKDGEEWPVEVHARAFALNDRPTILGIARDLGERDALKRRLLESDSRYRIVTMQTRQVIYDCLLAENRVRWLGAVEQVTGQSPEALESKGLEGLIALVHEEDRRRVREALERAISDIGPYHVNYRIMGPGADLRYIEDEGIALPGDDGKAYRILGTAKDVTARVREDAALRQVEQRVQHAQKLESLGVLAGGIAHDFNNILVAIIGLTDMAMREIPMDSRIYADLDEALRAAHRAKDLVKQILAFSRQEGQERTPFSLHVVVREVLKLARATLPGNIQIIEDVDTASGAVVGNVGQLHQVLMNFLTNANQAMQPRGGRIEVSLHDIDASEELAKRHPGLKPGPYLRLSVRDTGHGMTPAVLKRIFDPFYTTKGPGEGTGMGLAVVHGIISAHNGAILVESEPGKGAVFDTYLPRSEEPAPAESADSGTGEAVGRILLVDDEEIVIHFGQSALKRFGYEVTALDDPKAALAAFKKRPSQFDIVITDQVMPGMQGDELASAIKAIRPDIPIILFTGFSDRVVESEAKRIGISEILYKPLVADQLSRAVLRAIQNRPATRKE